MIHPTRQRLIACVLLCAIGQQWCVPPLKAQTPAGTAGVYRVSAGDVLRLNVPQQSALDRELTVSAGGSVYISQVGEIPLAGLTLQEARDLLRQRLRLYNPAITEVILTVMEYSALRVFVLGAVSSPGSYSFENPPTLWEVLRVAGGPAENASLAACRIITLDDGRPVSRTVNLSGYLTGESFPQDLLQGGDTLVVPTIADGVVGVPATSGVQVFGGVRTPTTVPIEQPTELLAVLMLAGAPLESAELHKIAWVHRSASAEGPDIAVKVDMRQFLRRGLPNGNPMVYPGDVIYLPTHRDGWLIRYLPLFLTTLTSAATIFLAYDTLTN
ncbi:MAG: polysaccharide biosynthesis/export family protein [Candidatus Krumholzibacteria bacterium]|nr:polysaccharide biosynthesis/export family protein [Candidatus Krumholzibacteria bacterium]